MTAASVKDIAKYLGINLKPARDMGMATIKVTSAAQALDDLEGLLGHSVRD